MQLTLPVFRVLNETTDRTGNFIGDPDTFIEQQTYPINPFYPNISSLVYWGLKSVTDQEPMFPTQMLPIQMELYYPAITQDNEFAMQAYFYLLSLGVRSEDIASYAPWVTSLHLLNNRYAMINSNDPYSEASPLDQLYFGLYPYFTCNYILFTEDGTELTIPVTIPTILYGPYGKNAIFTHIQPFAFGRGVVGDINALLKAEATLGLIDQLGETALLQAIKGGEELPQLPPIHFGELFIKYGGRGVALIELQNKLNSSGYFFDYFQRKVATNFNDTVARFNQLLKSWKFIQNAQQT